MSLRSESKGSSPRRGDSRSRAFLSMPSCQAARTRAVSVGSPAASTSPDGEKDSTASLHSAAMVRVCARCFFPAVHTSTTVIRFWVRVPVLSEQMTPAQPRVSTAGSRLTMALRRAMRCTPRASTMVTMAGRPSGMAATARETAVMNMSKISLPWRSPTPNMTAQTHRQTKERVLEISAIFRWRGVAAVSSSMRSPAMRPTSVFMPVPVITAVHRPEVMTVAAMTMLLRSARGVSGGRRSAGALDTGADSPVMADSSAFRLAHSRTRASAGTRSPASSRMRSPGTSRALSTRTFLPSRTALAMGADIFRRASRAFWALSSWEMEMRALTTTMTRMMTASIQSSPPLAQRDRAAAESSTRIMGSFIWPKNRAKKPSPSWCSSSLGPYCSSRRWASSWLRPRRRSEPSSSSTWAAGLVCHALIGILPFLSLVHPWYGPV